MDFSKILKFIGNILTNQTKEYFDNTNEESTYENNINIPLKYSDFPLYNGKIFSKPVETSTDNYDRLTMFFKGTPSFEFISLLKSSGYEQNSDVRFDKDNTYVIVERYGNRTKIAYHIKR